MAVHFEATVTMRDDVVVVALAGELDLRHAAVVATVLHEATLAAERAVVVDVERLSFLDSAGARVLTLARLEAEDGGVALALAAPGRALGHLLTATGVDAELPVFAAVRQAVTCYSIPRPPLQPALVSRRGNGGLRGRMVDRRRQPQPRP